MTKQQSPDALAMELAEKAADCALAAVNNFTNCENLDRAMWGKPKQYNKERRLSQIILRETKLAQLIAVFKAAKHLKLQAGCGSLSHEQALKRLWEAIDTMESGR